VTAVRLFAIAACLAATQGVLRLTAATDAAPAARLNDLPLQVAEWRGRDEGRLDRETEQTLQADAYTLRTYYRRASAVGLYVAYYATQRSGHTIHSPLNCLPGTGWTWLDRERESLPVAGGGSIDVNRAIAQKDATRMLLFYWYQSRGRVVASDYQNKFVLMRDALLLHRSDGALVRVVAPIAGGVDPSAAAAAFVAAVYPVLTRYLPE
jgi:EpsI family protein